MSLFDRIARATELANEQRDRYDTFFAEHKGSSHSVMLEFYAQQEEVEQAFLIMNHLNIESRYREDSTKNLLG